MKKQEDDLTFKPNKYTGTTIYHYAWTNKMTLNTTFEVIERKEGDKISIIVNPPCNEVTNLNYLIKVDKANKISQDSQNIGKCILNNHSITHVDLYSGTVVFSTHEKDTPSSYLRCNYDSETGYSLTRYTNIKTPHGQSKTIESTYTINCINAYSSNYIFGYIDEYHPRILRCFFEDAIKIENLQKGIVTIKLFPSVETSGYKTLIYPDFLMKFADLFFQTNHMKQIPIAYVQDKQPTNELTSDIIEPNIVPDSSTPSIELSGDGTSVISTDL